MTGGLDVDDQNGESIDMDILGTIMTVVDIADKSKGLFDWFTGVSHGEKLSQTVAELQTAKAEIQKLNDRILWAPNIRQAVSAGGRSAEVEEGREILATFAKHATQLNSDILVSSVSSTPSRLKDAFARDPFEVLFDARPLHRAKRPNDPDMLPIMFSDGGEQYVGWQKRGALPSLFDCSFIEFPAEPSLNGGSEDLAQRVISTKFSPLLVDYEFEFLSDGRKKWGFAPKYNFKCKPDGIIETLEFIPGTVERHSFYELKEVRGRTRFFPEFPYRPRFILEDNGSGRFEGLTYSEPNIGLALFRRAESVQRFAYNIQVRDFEVHKAFASFILAHVD